MFHAPTRYCLLVGCLRRSARADIVPVPAVGDLWNERPDEQSGDGGLATQSLAHDECLLVFGSILRTEHTGYDHLADLGFSTPKCVRRRESQRLSRKRGHNVRDPMIGVDQGCTPGSVGSLRTDGNRLAEQLYRDHLEQDLAGALRNVVEGR